MKTLLLTLSLAAAGVSTAHAQIYSPAVTRGAVLGGIAGALIGGHNHDRWGEGAVIGAAAGALLGAVVDQPQPRTVVYSQPQTVPCAPTVVSTPYVADCAPTQVVYVNNPPPVRVVQVAPAPRVVYVNSYAPYYAPRRPVVVVGHSNNHYRRGQTVVYTRSRGWGRD